MMKSLNILYIDDLQLETEIATVKFDEKEHCLVRIHVSNDDKDGALSLAKKMKTLLPHAHVVGCSCAGVMYKGQIHETGTLISIISLENTQIFSGIYPIEKSETLAAVSNKILSNVLNREVALAMLFISDDNLHVGDLMDDLRDKTKGITFVGGVAGLSFKTATNNTFVFNEDACFESAMALVTIENKYILTYADVVTGQETLLSAHTVTKTDGAKLLEVDNTPINSWLKDNLGISKFEEIENLDLQASEEEFLHYPLVLENAGSSGRFLRHDKPTDSIMQYGSSYFKEGDQFKTSYLSLFKTSEEWQTVCIDLQKISVEYMFFYSCIARRLYLKGLANWEMEAFKDLDICGAFLMGEIGTKITKSYFYHGACSMFTLAQKEKYAKINLSAFEDISKLKDSHDLRLNHILQKDSADVKFVNAVVFAQNQSQSRMIESLSYGLKPMADFLKEQVEKKYDKLCFITIKTLDEQANSSSFLKPVCEYTKDFVLNQTRSSEISFYSFDNNSLFFTADSDFSSDKFNELCQVLFSSFKSQFSQVWGNKIIINMAITDTGVGISEISEVAISTEFQSTLEKVIVCNNINAKSEIVQKEFEIVSKLVSIIENDGVVPYFQGIYDNKNNRFFAYEALMRLKESSGKMLFPGDFMEISKKYDLYKQLSLLMVLKVLDIFEKRDDIVTLNISMLDVLSKEFTDKLFEKLDQMKSAHNFVFELVETEQFDEREALQKFIRKVKNYGAKIAVDDFGSGYSNFIEIGNLEIDYIKLNGSLTELLGTDTSYDKILESISYMGKKMQVEMIAECVETAAMQKKIVRSGIRFSQGYLFSKPMPYEVLEEVSRNNPLPPKKNQKNRTASEVDDFFQNSKQTKREKAILYWGGVVATLLAIVAIFIFVFNNNEKVVAMSDTFQVELATAAADKISAVTEGSSLLLLAAESSVSSNRTTNEDIFEGLKEATETSDFDNIYITFDGITAKSADGSVLNVDISESYSKGAQGDVEILSPMTDPETGKDFFLLSTPIYNDGVKTGMLYGMYYTEHFASLLDVKSFGGEAFYHLCEVDGTPVVLSGDSNNLFKDGDMYTFIGSLTIKNGHTPESIKADMEENNRVLLKYDAGGTERTAVMVTVPGTPWCVVSIILDDVVISMVGEIILFTVMFAIFVVMIFLTYIFVNMIVHSRNSRRLITVLEDSYSLANSLQTSLETDILTRTYSRSTAIEKISEAIAKNTNSLQALITLDIDNFSYINSTFGSEIGDTYLQEFVSTVKSRLRSKDIMGRIDGDEFIVLLDKIENKEEAIDIVEKIFANAQKIKINNSLFTEVSLSAGIVISSKNDDSFENLNAKSNSALKEAKTTGKNKYITYDDI